MPKLLVLTFIVSMGIGVFEVGLALRGKQELGLTPYQIAMMFSECSLVMFVVQAIVFSPGLKPDITRWLIPPALAVLAAALFLVPRASDFALMVLALGATILMILGLYFVFVRPPLLPEDPRYMGTSLAEVQATIPGLLIWLQRVFWVMGVYMFATGLLTFYIAVTAFRARSRGIAGIVIAAGLASIGWMAVVNFIIASDFKWVVLSFLLVWAVAVMLYFLERPDSPRRGVGSSG